MAIGTPDRVFPARLLEFEECGMNSQVIILILVFRMLSCSGSCGTDHQKRDGAHSIPMVEQAPQRTTLTAEDIVAFDADPFSGRGYFAEFKVDRKYLEDVISTWHRVSADQWRHCYSHVLGGDRWGTITLRDGRRIRWMVRPGGLAKLYFPDGTVQYLAKGRPPGFGADE